MLQVDLSTLSGPDLRRLLDTTRERGQAALSYEVLQEMAARREAREQEGPRKLLPGRRRAEPRVIELNLGDPLDRDEDPDLLPDRDPVVEDADPVGSLTLERPRDPGPPPKRRRLLGAGFAIGIGVGLAAGAALGLGIAEVTLAPSDEPPAQTVAAYPPSAPAPVAPAPAPAAAPVELAQQAEPATAVPAEPEASAATPEPTEQAAAPAPPEPEAAPVETAQAEPAETAKCARQATPVDRTICETPQLQRLQRELREAYAQALGAHEDRDLLRQHQLEWRDARNSVSDPDRLTRLYEQRIRKLNAATADAERQR